MLIQRYAIYPARNVPLHHFELYNSEYRIFITLNILLASQCRSSQYIFVGLTNFDGSPVELRLEETSKQDMDHHNFINVSRNLALLLIGDA